MPLSEQEALRHASREALIKAHHAPYPSATYEVSHLSDAVRSAYEKNPDDPKLGKVRLAGRLMARRLMGAACFAELQDSSGRIQLYLRRDTLCPEEDKGLYNEIFKKHTSIGDIIGVEGKVFCTQKGEISIEVAAGGFQMLSKALHPLPIVKRSEGETGVQVHDAYQDAEQRYRQRYVDLVVNPEVRQRFIRRTRLVDGLRSFLNKKGYLEVETPILQPIWGGAAARPFATTHQALGIPLYLRIANELYLKRLIVGGYDGVYEFSKDFRNEGMSRFHNPEFTQVELYVAYKDYIWMADCVEEMLCAVAHQLHEGSSSFRCGEQEIDFSRPWARTTFYGALKRYTGHEVRQMGLEELRKLAQEKGIQESEKATQGQLLDRLFGKCCEPQFIHPTFVFDYPELLSPLAKSHRTEAGLVERFEVVCNGKEVCNAYSELNDPIIQQERLEAQLALAKAGDPEAPSVLDEDFIRALSYGMPPTAGLGVGIDRLAMLLLDAPSIQDVLFFPQMRPEE